MSSDVRSVVFGTDESCDVRISDDPYVSNRHCRVFEDDCGDVFVEDLGSTNGTTLRPDGGPPLLSTRVYGPRKIAPGTVIRVGRTDIPWRRA
ncbi:FHA domain-containing protein [Actinomycetospora termitidis]|uniref:FHA domain-containing protein n=1 Tax=Actinomycetospora termitidis TaxID=3053470 RepID=A0ABT7MHK4_9PSEU|nr:FHA domain-containing protein [Actinomycetospora sp. Odt1-22]MDL5159417.1 FHA domain-containing protein [Actinomycetospora sp. Odt1-22]